jgi:protein ImuA
MKPCTFSLPDGVASRLAGLFSSDPLARGSLEGAAVQACVGTGAAQIDAALPWGGLARGLHEIAAPAGDPAKAAFAASLAGRRSGDGGRPILWCRPPRISRAGGDPYGPGIMTLGLSPDTLILVETMKPADLLWVMEEGAKTRGLAAVVAEGVTPDLTASRRLQLAAEAGDGLVLLLPSGRQAAPSTASTRWFLRSLPSLPEAGGPGRPRWGMELWRCRGGGRPGEWIVEWDDAAFSLSVVSQLADRPLVEAGRDRDGSVGADGTGPGGCPSDGNRQDGGAIRPFRRHAAG